MQDLAQLIQQYRFAAIFIVVLLENVGLPIPCYPVLMVAAASAASYEQLLLMLLVGSIACIIADIGWYIAGNKAGLKIIGFICKISLSPDTCARNTGNMFARYGLAALVPAKFFPGISTISVVMAGATRVSKRAFISYESVGATIYVGGGLLLGVIFKDAIADALNLLDEWGKWGVAAIAISLGLFVSWKWVERQRYIRRLRMDRITVAELRSIIDAGDQPVIIDARNRNGHILEKGIPGSIVVDIAQVDAIVEQITDNQEVIVYCACPNEVSAAMVAKKLQKAGFRKVRPLLGGIEAWESAGYTVETLAA